MRVEHAKPHCASHELYKGILDGASRGVFNGRIHVHQGAQKTDAKQTNRNLLLSRRGAGQLQPAARDLRRRRQVHPRLDRRPARRGRDLLPALARHRRGGGARACSPTPSPATSSSASVEPRAPRARGVPLRAAAAGRRRPRRRSDASRGAAAAARAPRAPRSTSRRSARDFPDPRPARSTASRSSTSTAPPRAQKPRAVLDAIDRLLRSATTPTSHRGVHRARRSRRPPPTRRRARRVAPLPRRGGARRDRLRPRHDRGDQPGGVELGPAATSGPATRSLITELEHHSNIVPWQLARRGARRAAAWWRRSTTAARSCSRSSSALLSRRARASSRSRTSRTRSAPSSRCAEIVALAHAARRAGAGRRRAGGAAPARSTSQALGCDFYAFSGHKVYGPTGIGVLWGRRSCSRRCRPTRAAAA